MNKKNKKTKIKRIVALLGVVVVLVSLFAIPASAWVATDVPFYNYWDVSVFKPTKDNGKAHISSVSPETGTLTLKSSLTEAGKLHYEDADAIGLRLCDVCPELIVGESYVLNGWVSYTYSTNIATLMTETPFIGLQDADGAVTIWNWGEELTADLEYLESRIIIYMGKTSNDARFVPSECTAELLLWVNSEKGQQYEHHNLFGQMFDQAYSEGYSEGFADGNKEFIEENLMISKRNVSVTPVYCNQETYERLYGETYANLEYPFNGHTFDTRLLKEEYKGISNIPKGYGLIGYKIDFVPITFGDYYIAGMCDASFKSSQCFYYIDVSTVENENAVVNRWIDPYTFPGFEVDGEDVINLDWGYLGIKEGTKITKFSITYTLDVPMFEPHKWTETVQFYEFLFSFADQNSYGFQVGYEAGEDYGYSVGVQDAGEEKYAEGKKAGVTEGKNIGYKQGLDEGYDDGYADGSDDGWDAGFAEGKDKGYYEGRADEQENSSFFSLIYSVLDAPVQVISKVLNFEILGVNMSGLASSLVTLAILIVVVKHFV